MSDSDVSSRYSNGSGIYTPSTGSNRTAVLTTAVTSEVDHVHMVTYDNTSTEEEGTTCSSTHSLLLTRSIASDLNKSTNSVADSSLSIREEKSYDGTSLDRKTLSAEEEVTNGSSSSYSLSSAAHVSRSQRGSSRSSNSSSEVSAQTTGTESVDDSTAGEEEEEGEGDTEESDDDLTSTEEGSTVSSSSTAYTSHLSSHPKLTDTTASVFITETSIDHPFTTQESLLQGVQNGDLNIVKRSVTQRVLNVVTSCDQYKRSMLHIACSLGHFDIVKFLLTIGHPVDASSIKKQTPLMEACIGGHFKIVQLLVPETGDLDHVDEEGRSAAHYCALHGEVKCLNILCDHGSDICLEDNMNRTCIHYAAIKDHSDVIQCLIERGAELEIGDRDGQTPAHYAAQYNSLNCLELLLHSAVDITQGDVNGTQPIHLAAYHDRLESMKLLLKKGRANCSDIDQKGRNVLHKACQGNAINCLHWLLTTGRLGPNSVDSLGNTGLHYSASKGHQESYYCLLQHRADETSLNNEGLSPLDVARRNGKAICIQKAVEGKKKCLHCFEESNFKDKPYQTKFNKKLESKQEKLFATADEKSRTTDASFVTAKRSHRKPTTATKDNAPSQKVYFSQILATKYYGPPAF